MPNVKIMENGCRGCTLCSDICPVDVFEFDESKDLASVARTEDCIGCLSCSYLCPSQCIEIADYTSIRPFHRIEENVALVKKFLQVRPAAEDLSTEDLEIAYNEVGKLLVSFAEAITEVLGRGHKSVGRRAGLVAAVHIPEMYEEKGLEALMDRMQVKFGAAFDFDYTVTNGDVNLIIHPCGLLKAVQNAGDKPNESVLCLLFHEYWAGLVSAFTGKKYSYEVPQAGHTCRMNLIQQKE